MKKFLLSALFSTLFITACTPYHQQVQQGNIITSSMMAKLQPGMTKEQVAYILGSPDIKNPWNSNEWYYVYTNKEDGKPLVRNHLRLEFSNDKLSHIEGTYAPPAQLQYTVVQTQQ